MIREKPKDPDIQQAEHFLEEWDIFVRGIKLLMESEDGVKLDNKLLTKFTIKYMKLHGLFMRKWAYEDKISKVETFYSK